MVTSTCKKEVIHLANLPTPCSQDRLERQKDSHSGHKSFTRGKNRHASHTEAMAFSEKWPCVDRGQT